MNLENSIKFFAPKSPQLSDSPPATASDSLTITDVMASFGLTEAQARFGFELFLSKHGITSNDRAVEMLTDYGLKESARYRAIAELEDDIKRALVQLLATFAYQDYSRSAASTRSCSCCNGTGFKDAEVYSMKTMLSRPGSRQVREVVRARCTSCGGKGEISNACRCHGKGKVLDEEQSALQGVPVMKECPKCKGRGYARLPAETVRKAIGYALMTITQPTWSRSFKPFYELLIIQCHVEESVADQMLQQVTSNRKIGTF